MSDLFNTYIRCFFLLLFKMLDTEQLERKKGYFKP